MTISNAQFDKVIIIRDTDSRIQGIVIHDVDNQTKEFYKLEQMDMDDIQILLNGGQAHDVANGRERTPLSTNLEEVTVISKK